MKKNLTFLLLFCGFVANASTSITTSIVSGHWTLSGSPYLIHNDITVAYGDSLIIDAGVHVLFQGYYGIYVPGKLIAIGDSASPINFDVQDTTGWHLDPYISGAGGWAGINFSITSTGSEFRYVNVQHLKSSGISFSSNMVTTSCNFSNNKESGVSFSSSDYSIGFEMAGWNFFNNHDSISYLIYANNATGGAANIHNCNINNNSLVFVSSLVLTHGPVRFSENNVYQNGNISDSGANFILQLNGSYSEITHNKIYNNILKKTAPIVVYSGNVDINANYICNNQTLDSGNCGLNYGGGGIFLYGLSLDTGAYNYVVRNNIIANNYCAYVGGGIYDVSGNAKIINNTIVNNKSPLGCGIYIDFVPTIHIKNNIFYGNTNVGATYLSSQDIDGRCNTLSPIELSFDHNWIGHSYHQAVNFQPGSLIYYLSDTTLNQVGTTPSLIAPTATANVTESALTANFGLIPTSACIDHGTNFGFSGPVDYANNNRVIGSSIDIGAYEYGAVPFLQNNIITGNSAMSVYPNPAVNVLFVSTNEPNGQISIMDITGKEVGNKKVISTLTCMDIHNLPGGTYFAIWNNGTGEKAVQKLVVE